MSSLKLSRRSLFKLAGAASLAACSSRPARAILPYVKQPPELVPGVPRYYATSLVEDGLATGVIVEAHEGRPTKVEGNPDHPASLGGTRAIEQAAVLGLYDPDRLQQITERGEPAAWSAIERAFASRGRMHVLLEPTTSPIVIELVGRLRAAGIGVSFWAPFERRESLAGNAIVHGRPLQTHVDLSNADVIVSLDADLATELVHARRLADRRRVVDGTSAMCRLYAIETAVSPTGVIADHRWAVRPSDVVRIASALLHGGGDAPWIAAVARDLRRAGPRGVVIAGERQPPEVHALAAQLATTSSCIGYSEPVVFEAGQPSHELPELDGIDTLLVLGGNPAYTAPAFAPRIAAIPTTVYLGLYANETAAACRFAIAGQHDLERWDVARAPDGTLSPIQPLIEPLFGGRSVAQVLHAVLGDRPQDPRDELAAAWPRWAQVPLDDALARGAVPETVAPRVTAAPSAIAIAPPSATPLELAIRPHPFIYDGRYANNPWLQELPEPITKLAWDVAAQLSPATAATLGVATGDVVDLAAFERAIAVPVVVVPGHADGAITMHAGYGRTGAEATARGIGANAFELDGAKAIRVTRTGDTYPLAIASESPSEHGRPVALGGTLAQLQAGTLAVPKGPQPTLLAAMQRSGPQWAMQIDLTTCTGCTACVMACAAENNTPVVGKLHVRQGRDMHWLRIDRYVDDAGTTVVEPMACQHCEDAPCEYVCPVGATTHSPEGLNEMAYNRCVGTRFCSNNCPYKVRRFNWFDFKTHDALRVLGANPSVTVRDRGVMEKCTYCVQRLRRAEIDATVEHRALVSPQTACQQACPTRAIAFGTLEELAEQRRRPHSYAELHDQGTRPRTQYLARIRNPNPEIT